MALGTVCLARGPLGGVQDRLHSILCRIPVVTCRVFVALCIMHDVGCMIDPRWGLSDIVYHIIDQIRSCALCIVMHYAFLRLL
jgi:hypothetical protein